MYVIHFQVTGRGVFPYDMLRYDHCFPNDTGSAQSMEVEESVRYNGENRTILLASYTTNKNWKPTLDRWNSFGWGVFKIEAARKA